ncbi:serine hydrolase domain-containing protein [Leminorella grimontii]|uniref:serine hydrolase domain-containing protein n=1 Tax=Leminorella grimontii TaxID=82981 RepID=UPI0032203265
MQLALDSVISRAVSPESGERQAIVGTVVCVAQDGKPIYQRAAGFADRENAKPMALDTLFRLSSVTKPFVTAATGVLLERGKLSLEDDVTRWLPAFRPTLPNGVRPAITIEHLLSHSAGLNYVFAEEPEGPYHRLGVSDGMNISGLTLAENLHRIASAPLLYPPGTSVAYSVATDVLGAVVAAVCDSSLGEAIASLVCRPLGLRDAAFSVADPARLAVPYVNTEFAPRPMADDETMTNADVGAAGGIHFSPQRVFKLDEFQSGGTGMVGSADDVERLLQVFRMKGAPLFGAQTFDNLARDRCKKQEFGPGYGFASSWQVLKDPAAVNSPQSCGTISWGGVYGHSWFIDFERSLSVVVLTNTAPEGLFGQFPGDVCRAVYSQF